MNCMLKTIMLHWKWYYLPNLGIVLRIVNFGITK